MNVIYGGKAYISTCTVSAPFKAILVGFLGYAVLTDVTGKGELNCTAGCMLINGTTIPDGGASWENAFEPNNAHNLQGDSTDDAPEPEVITTQEFLLQHSDSYCGSWTRFKQSDGTQDNDVRQGFANGYQIYGCMWFDNTAIAALANKAIKSATLRLHRQSGYGRDGTAEVRLYGLKIAYSTTLSGRPTLTASYYNVLEGGAKMGETREYTISQQVITDLANGVIQG